MGRRFTYYQMANPTPPDYSAIFGANLFDWWNFNDAASLSLSGSLIDSVISQVSSRPIASTGSLRPTLITDATLSRNVADFDGIVTKMGAVAPATTSTYKFLHDGSGGAVILISRNTLSGATQVPLSTAFGIAQTGFRLQQTASNTLSSVVVNGTTNVVIGSSSNTFSINQWNSCVQVIDADNATASDRVENILNGTSTKNNATTGTPSAGASSRILDLGKADAAVGAYFKGQISEILIINTIPTPTQLSQLQTYLDYIYGTFPI